MSASSLQLIQCIKRNGFILQLKFNDAIWEIRGTFRKIDKQAGDTAETSVQVKLYSGDTLLTTATLQGVNPGSYGFLTCCIATETADANWALTPWTPKDDVVPNKVVLFVDDNEMDTMEFTLDAAEWKALPGTVLPSSNVTNGTTSNNDKLDNVPQTGDTSNLALWIALLFISGGAAIGTTVVSRKKKYNR